jgi:hypothetical protein
MSSQTIIMRMLLIAVVLALAAQLGRSQAAQNEG